MTRPVAFDTFYHINKLKTYGVPEKHAEAYVEMMAEIVESKLATTDDTEKIRGEIKLMGYKLGSAIVIAATFIIGVLGFLINLKGV